MEKAVLCIKMAYVLRMHRMLVNRSADEAGAYLSQHRLLKYIATNPGCTQTEIAQKLEQSGAAVSLATKRLVELGLVRKQTSGDSLRANSLSATEKGLEVVEKMKTVVDMYSDKMFSGFSAEEMETLNDFVERMKNNLIESEEKEKERDD